MVMFDSSSLGPCDVVVAKSGCTQRGEVVEMPGCTQCGEVVAMPNRLRGTRHYISSQMPPSKSERKQFVMPLYKSMKADPANQAKIQQEKLIVKGKVQSQFLSPILPEVPEYADRHISMEIPSKDMPPKLATSMMLLASESSSH